MTALAGGQQAINNQVWKPFIETYNNHDTQGFLAGHSKDVVRSPREAKSAWNWDEYFRDRKMVMNKQKPPEQKENLNFDLRNESRTKI